MVHVNREGEFLSPRVSIDPDTVARYREEDEHDLSRFVLCGFLLKGVGYLLENERGDCFIVPNNIIKNGFYAVLKYLPSKA